jgi:ArsR family transcriptional regulator, arsenate/arsenite/antimonite-responsive transcriptional repressor
MPIVRTLKALADEKRLKILHMLLDNDLCVDALARQLGISKPAVSQHLRVLR